jgi:4'-phosphopantetheinyl transferase EntD
MNSDAARHVRSELQRLLPPGVAVAASEPGHTRRTLLDSERQSTTNMSPRRLLEYAAGRACAHEALAHLGVKSDGVAMGPRREPLWPSGTVGSISHCGGLALAAVAPRSLLNAVGIDIEPALPLDSELLRHVCRPTELARLQPGPDAAIRAKLIFSAKESVYKCLWPAVRQFLEFTDVEIVPDDSPETFRMIGWGPLRDRSWAQLTGRYAITAGHIVTAAYIAATPSACPAIPA